MFLRKYAAILFLLPAAMPGCALAQMQSSAPADRAVARAVSGALVKAGIDPRITSVQVIATSGHVIYLSGLIGDQNTIKLAGAAAAKAAPGWRVVNNIHSGFFDDPSHVTGDMTK
jgi:hypothetical protein